MISILFVYSFFSFSCCPCLLIFIFLSCSQRQHHHHHHHLNDVCGTLAAFCFGARRFGDNSIQSIILLVNAKRTQMNIHCFLSVFIFADAQSHFEFYCLFLIFVQKQPNIDNSNNQTLYSHFSCCQNIQENLICF